MAKAGPGGAGRPEYGAIGLAALVVTALVLLSPLAALCARTPESPADAPVRRFQTLLTRKNVTKDALRKLETELDQARSARPDGINGAKATFFLARVQQELALRTGQKADWYRAAETFGACAERFPKYQLAPDALLHRGRIRLERLSDADGALADFQTIRRVYPRSPLAASAAKLQSAAVKATVRSRPGTPEQAQPEPPAPRGAPPGEKPLLLEVRPKNTGQSARVVLDIDARVKYRYRLLEHPAAKGVDGRIYVDLLGTAIRPGLDGDVTVPGGVLKHLRVAPKGAEATRVVMDFTGIKDYRVTALDNPFRLVIDAFSSAEAKAATPAPTTAPEEPPPSFAPPKGNRKKLAADLVEQLGLSVRTIMVDAGHGGKDPGARGYGLQEKDLNLRMALVLGKALKVRGFRVLYTRTTDDFLALEERTALANAKRVDLFISVHCNAHTDPAMHGLETYSLNLARTPDAVRVAARENSVSDKNISDLQMILTDLMLTSKIKESLDLARGVHRMGLAAIRRKWTVADHGNREAPFYVLMGAKMPSALLEIGYITNKSEAARLNTDAYLHILADGIADGIVEYKQQIERFTGK